MIVWDWDTAESSPFFLTLLFFKNRLVLLIPENTDTVLYIKFFLKSIPPLFVFLCRIKEIFTTMIVVYTFSYNPVFPLLHGIVCQFK